jgi:hypothetical protein
MLLEKVADLDSSLRSELQKNTANYASLNDRKKGCHPERSEGFQSAGNNSSGWATKRLSNPE